MTNHSLTTLSNSTATLLTPNGVHSGTDVTLQNVNASGYIYLGGNATVSSTNYGFRILPNHSIFVALAVYAVPAEPAFVAVPAVPAEVAVVAAPANPALVAVVADPADPALPVHHLFPFLQSDPVGSEQTIVLFLLLRCHPCH
jgi:hypothetical protein